MTRVHAEVYRGPFTSPRRLVVDQPKSLIVGEGCKLEDRLLYLARTKHTLEDCQNPPELRERIFELAFKNFIYVGKSPVYAGFWNNERFAALAIPENQPAFPQNASSYVKVGAKVEFPFQPEIIEHAIATKELVVGGSEKESFLAVPFITEDREHVLGILLLSNRLSEGRKKITSDDVEVARTLGEIASEALNRFPDLNPLS